MSEASQQQNMQNRAILPPTEFIKVINKWKQQTKNWKKTLAWGKKKKKNEKYKKKS